MCFYFQQIQLGLMDLPESPASDADCAGIGTVRLLHYVPNGGESMIT